MVAIIAPMNVGRRRPLTAVIRYGAGHRPKSPSAIASNDATTQLEIPLVPNDGERGLTPAAITPAVITGRYPSPTVTVFLRGQPQLKRSSEIYCSYTIKNYITINLLDEEARDPESP